MLWLSLKKNLTVKITVQLHYKATCLFLDVLLPAGFYYVHCQQWTFCLENPPPSVKGLAESNEESNSDIRLKWEHIISFSSCSEYLKAFFTYSIFETQGTNREWTFQQKVIV